MKVMEKTTMPGHVNGSRRQLTKHERANKKEYRHALEILGVTIIGAAEVLGVSSRQSQRYAAGEIIPKPTLKLIRLVIKNKMTREQIENL